MTKYGAFCTFSGSPLRHKTLVARNCTYSLRLKFTISITTFKVIEHIRTYVANYCWIGYCLAD